MNGVARKKLTEANLIKAFGKKLFKLCKSRTKKSSPDLFEFYVISAGHGMVNDAGRVATSRRSFKAHDKKQNIQKMKGLLKKRALTGNSLKFLNQKTKKSSLRMENKTK